MKTLQNLMPSWLAGVALVTSLTCEAQVSVYKIAAGSQHSLFLKTDGSVWAMGNNYYGQLGDGLGEFNTNVPQMIIPFNASAVAARGNHSFFQLEGSLFAMGDNQYGELGDGTTNNIYVPKSITGLIAFAAGYEHTLFTRSFGTSVDLDAMGDNTYGELGDGTYVSHSSPERIERDSTLLIGSTQVTAVAAGSTHSLLLKSDGSLWSMGYDGNGQLGNSSIDGGMFKTNKAEKILPGGVRTIAAGYAHTLFIKTDGSLWAVGDNTYGELGNPGVRTGNVNGFTNTPVMVVPNSVIAIAGGFYDSFFIEADGSLWSMGYNSDGQLGNGVTPIGNNFTNQPVKVVAADVSAVAAGDNHTLFVLYDGSLWGMGQSFEGQLGPNYTTDQNQPVQIIGPMVANGGFETGDFTGWTRGQPEIPGADFIATDPAVVHSGLFGAALQGPSEFQQIGSLSQTLRTTPGMSYSISFWVNSADGLHDNELQATWGSTVLPGLSNLVSGVWTHLQYHLTATNAATVLQFNVGLDPSRLGLDDVTVVPLVRPVLTGINITATDLVLAGTNCQWGGTYVTLASTNLTKPLNQWTPIATNIMDGSGSFGIIAANVINPGDRDRFFALQLQ